MRYAIIDGRIYGHEDTHGRQAIYRDHMLHEVRFPVDTMPPQIAPETLQRLFQIGQVIRVDQYSSSKNHNRAGLRYRVIQLGDDTLTAVCLDKEILEGREGHVESQYALYYNEVITAEQPTIKRNLPAWF